MRAHPDNYPVVKRNRYLRSAPDQQVADYYGRHQGDTPHDAAARDQAIAEMQRRDVAQERREATEERRRARWSQRKIDRTVIIENETVKAEAATRGVMLNRAAGSGHRTPVTVHRPGVASPGVCQRRTAQLLGAQPAAS